MSRRLAFEAMESRLLLTDCGDPVAKETVDTCVDVQIPTDDTLQITHEGTMSLPTVASTATTEAPAEAETVVLYENVPTDFEGEVNPPPTADDTGTVKWFNDQKGFGFI